MLKEQGATPSDARSALLVNATGAQAAPSLSDVKSPETYPGYERQDNFSSPQPVRKNEPARYTAPLAPMLNQWGLAGQWNVRAEDALLMSSPGAIRFRFHARDLHLVLGSASTGRPVRFRVLLDDAAPLDDRGVDVDADGTGLVTGHRLYQLVRQKAPFRIGRSRFSFSIPASKRLRSPSAEGIAAFPPYGSARASTRCTKGHFI